jgi:hypothetical protein
LLEDKHMQNAEGGVFDAQGKRMAVGHVENYGLYYYQASISRKRNKATGWRRRKLVHETHVKRRERRDKMADLLADFRKHADDDPEADALHSRRAPLNPICGRLKKSMPRVRRSVILGKETESSSFWR